MKILVYGAGVIGSYLVHVLCTAGNDVTVLARGKHKEVLESHGLEIYHHLQHKTTNDKVRVIDHIDKDMNFDAVFAVMPFHKMTAILTPLSKVRSPIVILVGNNLAPAQMADFIEKNSVEPKEVLFGFQVTGGKKEENRVICERFGASYMDIGSLHKMPSDSTKLKIENMFLGIKYKLNWQSDMEAYLICHPAAILPIGYLSYVCGGNLRKSTRSQRKLMFDASHEAYELLKAKGIKIYPKDDDKFYSFGFRGLLMKLLYFFMAKTQIGDLVACEHCRNAVTEMEEIDKFYENLILESTEVPMENWKKLRFSIQSYIKSENNKKIYHYLNAFGLTPWIALHLFYIMILSLFTWFCNNGYTENANVICEALFSQLSWIVSASEVLMLPVFFYWFYLQISGKTIFPKPMAFTGVFFIYAILYFVRILMPESAFKIGFINGMMSESMIVWFIILLVYECLKNKSVHN